MDYAIFLRAIDEVCGRTGWRLHAYVLMPNHFHWLIETREANLVAGMKWFLGAYSQRFNNRHGQRGHVFQGRYKAVVIDATAGNYFETVSTYIHLNPARANMIQGEKQDLGRYAWSSYPEYLKSMRNRPTWLSVDRVLGNLGLRDDTAGRKRYASYLQERVRELRTRDGRKSFREEWKQIRYGWYLGDEAFQEKLLKLVGKVVDGRDRRSYSGGAICGHDELEAERYAEAGMMVLGLKDDDLATMAKGDEKKCVLAWLLHARTLASQRWIAERLCMGNPSNISTHVKAAGEAQSGTMAVLRGRLEQTIQK